MLIQSTTETPEMIFDGDTTEGKEGLKEALGVHKLDAHTWMPFAATTYELPKDPEDYIYTVTPLFPADLPNRNAIGFPLAELIRFQPPPVARQVYKAWTGCPLHVEHQNEDYRTAIGMVLDTSLRQITGFNNSKIWKVMGLVATSKTKAGDLAKRALDRSIDTFSMGADCEFFSCSYCGRKMERYNHCNHLNPENQIDWNFVQDPDGSKHLVFRNAHFLSPIELSWVEDPAWIPAKGNTLSDGLTPKDQRFNDLQFY